MKIKYLIKHTISSNEQSYVQHAEEKEVVVNRNCAISCCLFNKANLLSN